MMDRDSTADRATQAPVTLTIDGKKITATRGQTVLEAATANGIHIPTLCYLKELSPIGSCRVCVVEVEGAERPQASCQLPVVEGMQVTTQSDRLREERKMMVQLLLVNHPLDCPVCERSGECRLQNLTYELGITQQIFKAEPVARQKHSDWGVVRYNPNLCVLCERCVRACTQVQGVSAYKVRDNGYRSVIDTRDGQPLNCDFCGRCISVCPVGALNSGLKLQARSWELQKVASVCPYCGTGCAINLEVKKDRIFRVSATPENGINQGNLCAKGRFGFQFVESQERLRTPLIRQNGQLVEASWDEALALVADTLGKIKKAQGGQAIGGIGSERLPNEDNFVFQKFFKKSLGSNLIDHPRRMQNPSVAAMDGHSGSSEDLLKADLILTVGAEPAEENPVVGNLIRRAMEDNSAALITLFDRQVRFKPHPHVKLTHAPGLETTLLRTIAQAIDAADAQVADAAKAAGVAPAAILRAVAKLKQAKAIVILCGRSAAGPALDDVLALAAKLKATTLFYSEYCNTRGAQDMGLRPEPGADLLALAEAGKLKALYVMGEDPATRLRGGSTVLKALKKIDFLVVQDMFLTPTAALAQVVLPTVSFAEREGTFTNLEGRVQKLQRAISPRGQAKPDWQIVTLLEKHLSGQFNYDSVEDIFKDIAATVPAYRGMTYAQLGTKGSLAQYAKGLAKPAQAVAPADGGQADKDLPFVLLEGNSFFHLAPYSLRAEALMGVESQCRAEISPRDAAELKVQDGDSITVASADGSLMVKAKVTEKIVPGTVFIPDGFEANPVNALRSVQKRITRVKITKADTRAHNR
jgi:NADH-quinone oxidoreductase chain G